MMSLPVDDFRFLSDVEVECFDVMQVAEDSPVGYILEVDLDYPPELHLTHNSYPLCPEHLTVKEDMLSDMHVAMLNHLDATNSYRT